VVVVGIFVDVVGDDDDVDADADVVEGDEGEMIL
jgi:hypothetical protein